MKKNSCDGKTYHIFFRNLANPVKTEIISLLKDKSMFVKEISESAGLEQSKTSHALSSLRKCNIVQVKQKGKERVYSLNKKTILPILKIIDTHKCKYCRFCK